MSGFHSHPFSPALYSHPPFRQAPTFSVSAIASTVPFSGHLPHAAPAFACMPEYLPYPSPHRTAYLPYPSPNSLQSPHIRGSHSIVRPKEIRSHVMTLQTSSPFPCNPHSLLTEKACKPVHGKYTQSGISWLINPLITYAVLNQKRHPCFSHHRPQTDSC
jgi:hypothetical protein